MNSIIGHQEIIKYLRKAKSSDQLAHAYLFIGPRQVGKSTLAKSFAESLFNSKLEGNPDFFLAGRDDSKLSIGKVRELKSFFQKKPFSADIKIAILMDADAMLPVAQNSLLKTLEEPPGKSLLILTSSQPDNLLPTIFSRVEAISFGLVPNPCLESFLKIQGIGLEQSRQIIRHSANRPGKLVASLADTNYNKTRHDITAEILNSSGLVDRFNLAKTRSSSREEVRTILDIYLGILRDVQKLTLGETEGIANQDFIEQLEEIYKKSNLIQITNKLELVLKSINRLKLGVNQRLVLESLFIQV